MRHLAYAALAGLCLLAAGCAGSGTVGFSPSPVPANRIVFLAATSETSDGLFSTDLAGGDERQHAQIAGTDTVWGVSAAGDRLLIERSALDGTSSAYLIDLDGQNPLQLSPIRFDVIESMAFSRDYASIVIGGVDSDGISTVVTLPSGGGAGQVVENVARMASFGPAGSLVIGGEADGELDTSFVGTMKVDGTDVTVLLNGVDPIGLDFSPGASALAYSASVGGDASGSTAIATIPLAGGAPATLVSSAHLNVSPKFSLDGASVYFIREGVGVMRVPTAGGAVATVAAVPNALHLVTVR